jgi:acetyl-CoA carboxylase biotin carboxyl carrier protein
VIRQTTKAEKSGVAKDPLTYDDLLQIVELIKSAEAFSEFHLKIGEIELDLRKANAGGAAAGIASATPLAAAAQPSAAIGSSVPSASAGNAAPAGAASSAQRSPPQKHERPKADIPPGSVVIESPMVGTFYRRPDPNARPFVEVGDAVDADTTVCIIEVMKLMNSITAGSSGRVSHILVDDAEPVQAGQPLIVIDPQG